jgi:4-hydroxy-tetrahydrodipicolinate synthase
MADPTTKGECGVIDEPLFRGIGVALVTLFDEEGTLLPNATAAHAARLVDHGIRAVLVAGTTGEAAMLPEDDRAALISAVRAELPAEVPVIAGVGHARTEEAVRLTEVAQDSGADAVLALSPPGSVDLVGYYAAVAAAAPTVPVLAYHFPAASAPGVPVEELPKLPVQGIKDSSGDAERLLTELSGFDGQVYVGSSAVLALAGPCGATGALLALANLEPERCADAFAGDVSAQRDLVPAHLRARVDFPAGIKRDLAARYGTSPAIRRAPLPAAG